MVHDFGTLEEAETSLNSVELRGAMQSADVDGRPRIEIYQNAWQAPYSGNLR